MITVFISVEAGKVGEKRVVAASGIIILETDDGAPTGAQLSGSIHEVLCDPFHVYETISDFDKVFSNCPKFVGKYTISIFAIATQLSAVSEFDFPHSNN